jgi:cytochrome c oxidase subunit IV
MAAHVQTNYDDADPHHELASHGHVIIRPRTLIAVLSALLMFTVLTVFCSRFEVWAAHKFHVDIPQLVNVLICLSIAVVKSVLVAMFFMQLKYDNPLNAIVFLFCLFAFSLFLFFSMTDLGTRAMVYAYKSGEIQKGGLGVNTQVKDERGNVLRGIDTGQLGIVEWSRKQRIEELSNRAAAGTLKPALAPGETPEARWEKEAAIMRHAEPAPPPVNTANRTVVPARGPTPDLFTPDSMLESRSAEHGREHGGH